MPLMLSEESSVLQVINQMGYLLNEMTNIMTSLFGMKRIYNELATTNTLLWEMI